MFWSNYRWIFYELALKTAGRTDCLENAVETQGKGRVNVQTAGLRSKHLCSTTGTRAQSQPEHLKFQKKKNFWKHGLLLLLLLLSTPQNRSGGLQHSCSDLLINHLYHAGLFFYMQPEAEGFTVDHYRWVTAATLSFCPTAQMVSAATLWTNHHLALLIYRILSFCCGLQKLHSLHMNY